MGSDLQKEIALPDGWCLARVQDVAEKTEQRTPRPDESFIYVDIGSINRNSKTISDPQRLKGAGAPSRARKVINAGDVLVSLTRPNLNAVALVPQALDQQIASTGFEVIKPKLVEGRYLFALVRSKEFIEAISGAVQGALYPAAKSADVQFYEFPLPPLAEQKAIADKLDTLLAQVETTKARLERIPDILKRFRQSVLAAAVSGRLTEVWRTGKACEAWRVLGLGEIVGEIEQGWSPKCLSYPASVNDWGVIKTSAVQSIDFVSAENKKLPNELKVREKLKVSPGDILTTRAGPRSRCGITCYVQTVDRNLMICDKVYRYRVREEHGISKFLALQLNEFQ
ncbi:restriction endonuclease subunit S [Pseudomonas sp.]|uniref:restriction endonuclease subunit S n=1 Tax=Pseudomonas sp. TaxID=306 RepID=UPI00272AAEBA|nr:restriction endonuclease subunit S [Pseudomonas sp.]